MQRPWAGTSLVYLRNSKKAKCGERGEGKRGRQGWNQMSLCKMAVVEFKEGSDVI